jgi:hypothetical protein
MLKVPWIQSHPCSKFEKKMMRIHLGSARITFKVSMVTAHWKLYLIAATNTCRAIKPHKGNICAVEPTGGRMHYPASLSKYTCRWHSTGWVKTSPALYRFEYHHGMDMLNAPSLRFLPLRTVCPHSQNTVVLKVFVYWDCEHKGWVHILIALKVWEPVLGSVFSSVDIQ